MSDMPWKPDVTVAAVVERDGQFLVVEERASRRIVVNQPAGHLENGETLTDAVVRETLEETGWTFEPEALVGIYLWKPARTQRTFLRVAFCGPAIEHHARRPLDHGIVRARWLTRAQLDALGPRLRSPLVLRCIDDYLANARYPLALLTHLMPDADEQLAAQA
jgi:8-oxo-dGTP pyrophosphatase MutT (NUDIX family)